MYRDRRGLPITAASEAAAAHLDRTLEAYLGFRADVGDHLKQALAADPHCALALCTRGYFLLLMAVRALVPKAREALSAATAIKDRVSPREQAHIAALTAWCDGDIERALGVWERILEEHPRDVLALKLANFWHFYLGQSERLRDSVAQALRGWDEQVPGYGYVLGLHAFGLEETGDYAAAERTGRRAIELNPADIWATHAVAHVMEMQDRPRDGIAWIESRAADFTGCNNFRFHVWWHRCLFHLELGEAERALALYDREVRAESTSDYLDICNAVSLLWRLEDRGVAAGKRWGELAKQAASRIDDHILAFVDVHFAMALAGAKDPWAERMLQSTRARAEHAADTEARILAEIGADLCEAVVAHRRRDWPRVIELLMLKQDRLIRIGGSHAQRDLFHKMLITACLGDDRTDAARALLGERLHQRPNNAWAKTALAKL